MNYQLPYEVHKQLGDQHDEMETDLEDWKKCCVWFRTTITTTTPLSAVRNQYVYNCKQYKYLI